MCGGEHVSNNISETIMGSTMDKVDIRGNGEEPTMEDILSSIRKIIAEDKTSEAAALAVDETSGEIDLLGLDGLDDNIDIEDALKIPDAADVSSETADIEALIDEISPDVAVSEPANEEPADDSVLDLDSFLNGPEP